MSIPGPNRALQVVQMAHAELISTIYSSILQPSQNPSGLYKMIRSNMVKGHIGKNTVVGDEGCLAIPHIV